MGASGPGSHSEGGIVMSNRTVGILVGSLRKGSYSRAVARYLASVAPARFHMKFIEIGSLPLYNPDFDDEGHPPAEWVRFRGEIEGLDGCLFVTPEYNRSIPAALKNALDVGSRPYGRNTWSGKAGGIVSVSPGRLGAFGANHHLRQPMVFLNVLLLQQPEAYVGDIASCLNDRGEVTDEATQKHLKQFMEAFAKWVDVVASLH